MYVDTSTGMKSYSQVDSKSIPPKKKKKIKEVQKPLYVISTPKCVPLISCNDFFEIDKNNINSQQICYITYTPLISSLTDVDNAFSCCIQFDKTSP